MGRLRLHGVDLTGCSARDWFDLLWALLPEYAEAQGPHTAFADWFEWGNLRNPDAATWGEGAEAQAGLEAMVAQMGGQP